MDLFKLPKYFYLCFIFVLLAFVSNGQDVSKYLERGDAFFAAKNYDKAIIQYQEALNIDSNNVDANYSYGMSLFKNGSKAQTLPYFKKTHDLDPHHNKYLYRYLGRAFQLNFEFDSAIFYYNEYETHLHKHEIPHQKTEKETIDKRIFECKSALELIKTPKKVIITNLGSGINSKYDDYSPALSADEKKLMFTSRRDHKVGFGNEFSKKDQEYYEEVFVTERKDSIWTDATSLGSKVNGRKHDASVSTSADGHKLIIYKSHHKTNGDLHYSSLKKKGWSKPKRFGGDINTTSFEPSATINIAENLLIFSSDRPGGYGGLDLYISRLLPTGKWGKSRNLGPKINTKYDEDAPFLQADEKTLHFSSSGHNSMGGYDIFTTEYDEEHHHWSEPVNAGVPINTPDDDIYFIWNKEGNRSFFSSVREGGFGGQDIYQMDVPKPTNPVVMIKGSVTDKKTKKPLNALIQINIYSIATGKEVGVFNAIDASGKFLFAIPHNDEYGLRVEAEGYTFYSEHFTAPKVMDYFEIEKNIELEPIEVGHKIVLNNIFFDYNKSTLRPQSDPEIKAVVDFMTKYDFMRVEIGGHTDNIGSLEYNQKLSEARAQEVRKRLVSLGIQSGRLTYKGYSYSKPIETNTTPEGRQLNRRTEFLILKNSDEIESTIEVK